MTDITPDTRRAENLRATLASVSANLGALLDASRLTGAHDNLRMGTLVEDRIANVQAAAQMALEDDERMMRRG